MTLAIRRSKEGRSFRLKSKSDNKMNVLQLLEDLSIGYDGDDTFAITRERRPFVFVGPDEWIKQNMTKRGHALTCNCVDDPSSDAIFSWIKSAKRRPSILVSKLMSTSYSEIISFVVSFKIFVKLLNIQNIIQGLCYRFVQ